MTDKKALIARCRSGDREALGWLYSAYAQRMMRVVCHYVDDWQAAQDVLHDGFLIIYSRIGQLRNPDSLEYWMATIMKNLALQYLRDADITRLLDDDFVAMDVPDFEESITMEQLEVMINRLPLGYRSVFRLAVLEHKSHREIAKILGISEQTSGSQLYHARVLLRRMVNEYRLQAGLLVTLSLIAVGIWMHRSHEPSVITPPTVITPPHSGSWNMDMAEMIGKGGTERRAVSVIERTSPNPEISPDIPADETRSEELVYIAGEQPESPVNDTLSYTLTEPFEQYTAEQQYDYSRQTDGVGIEVALAGIPGVGQRAGNEWMIPGNPSTNDPGYTVAEEVRYRIPISVELRVVKILGERWSVGAALRYTRHQTDRSLMIQYASGKFSSENQSITADYLGIPLTLQFRAITSGRFGMYATAGMGVDFPLHASVDCRGDECVAGRSSFRAPVLYSLSAGAVLQYRFTPQIALYVQPTATYTFRANSPYPLLPAYRRWTFSAPLGLSFTW